MPATSPEAIARAKDARRWRVSNRLREVARTLDLYKTSLGCSDCGYRGHPAALQFDHIDPETKLESLGWRESRSKLTSRAKFERYLSHVQKYCEVRCANCHAVRTVREKHWLSARERASAAGELLF